VKVHTTTTLKPYYYKLINCDSVSSITLQIQIVFMHMYTGIAGNSFYYCHVMSCRLGSITWVINQFCHY
jgi:hypothetical protein